MSLDRRWLFPEIEVQELSVKITPCVKNGLMATELPIAGTRESIGSGARCDAADIHVRTMPSSERPPLSLSRLFGLTVRVG
jgi:hypothetical protein